MIIRLFTVGNFRRKRQQAFYPTNRTLSCLLVGKIEKNIRKQNFRIKEKRPVCRIKQIGFNFASNPLRKFKADKARSKRAP